MPGTYSHQYFGWWGHQWECPHQYSGWQCSGKWASNRQCEKKAHLNRNWLFFSKQLNNVGSIVVFKVRQKQKYILKLKHRNEVNSTQACAKLHCLNWTKLCKLLSYSVWCVGVFVNYGQWHVGLSGCVCKIATQQILMSPGLNKLTSIIVNIVFTM